MQFTAAGHVLGFQPDGYYVAGGDHMLHVGFVGAAGVTPRAADEGDGKTRLLKRVTYENLWPGVNLRYDAAHPLLIDPTLVWNATMGSGVDSGWGVAVDRSGNVYVAGRSDATWGIASESPCG